YLAKQWEGFPPRSAAVDFDDRLEIYARTDQQGNCSIRRAAGDQKIVLLPGWSKPTTPYLSRDGRFVAVIAGDGRLQGWQLVGSRSELFLEALASPVRNLDFRADSRWLALAHRDGAIRVYELATGRQLYHLQPSKNRLRVGVALHPTEPLIAVFSYL